jgi:vacuolar-type H+-ATPase subunit I/STV1
MPEPILTAKLTDIIEETSLSNIDEKIKELIEDILDREGFEYYDIDVPPMDVDWESGGVFSFYRAGFKIFSSWDEIPYYGRAYGSMLPKDETHVILTSIAIEVYEKEEKKLSEEADKKILESELTDILEETSYSNIDEKLEENIKYLLDREGFKYYDVVVPPISVEWELSGEILLYSADFEIFSSLDEISHYGVVYGTMSPVDENTVEIRDMTIEVYEKD